ncbi:hypothetical protein D5H01_14545 [Staphylococcus aureus]|nr:hypothetical protein D5H01_14545 [Staphylococcus aureus]
MSKRNSTGNASWGGPQQREIGFPISTDNASWVGRRNKFCENIISVPLPRKGSTIVKKMHLYMLE